MVALFEVTHQGDDIKVVEERYYRLIPVENLKLDTR